MLKKDDAKNIKLLIAKKEIKERFEIILTDLRKTVEGNGYAVRTVEHFRSCLNITNPDVSQLPLYSAAPFSHHQNKIHCTLCEVSCAVQLYWSFCAGDKDAKELLSHKLDILENYAAKGLAAFKIVGTRYPDGFYLEEIK